jgi:hypothetical protein
MTKTRKIGKAIPIVNWVMVRQALMTVAASATDRRAMSIVNDSGEGERRSESKAPKSTQPSCMPVTYFMSIQGDTENRTYVIWLDSDGRDQAFYWVKKTAP